MKNWIIIDWSCNRCFVNHRFKTSTEAWDFLYSTFSTDEEIDEFYVVKELLIK
jgi:hypothetical protein